MFWRIVIVFLFSIMRIFISCNFLVTFCHCEQALKVSTWLRKIEEEASHCNKDKREQSQLAFAQQRHLLISCVLWEESSFDVMQEVYLDNQDLLTYKAKNEEERKSGTAVEAQIGCYWQKLYYWCDTLWQKLNFCPKITFCKKNLSKH